MKKTLLIAAVISLGMISCKKKYSCECITTTTYPNTTTSPDVNVSSATDYDTKMSKKQAQAACDHEAVSIKSTFDNSFTENNTKSNFANVSSSCQLK